MKIQTKFFCSLSLFLLVSVSWVTVAGALTLTRSAVSDGQIGSALGGGTYHDSFISSTNPSGRFQTVDEFDSAGPVTYNYSLPVGTVSNPGGDPLISGYSDSGNLKMGAMTRTSTDNSRASLTSTFGNSITVGAVSGSGLADGALTTMTVTIRLDGATSAIADRNSASDSIASLSSLFQLWDPSQADIDFDPYLLRFNSSIWNHAQAPGDGSLQHDDTWNWKVSTGLNYRNRDTVIANDSGDNSYTLDTNQQNMCLGNASCDTSFFDTGLLEFTVDTYVGAELLAFGWMQSGSDITGSGYARSSFLNTFGATITAADGIDLSFAVEPPADTGGNGDTAPVPEPSTLLLLGSGLLGLAWYGRKRKQT